MDTSPSPAGGPDPSWFPRDGLGAVTAAVMATMAHMFGDAVDFGEANRAPGVRRLRGHAASAGQYTGVVRVLHDACDFASLRHGEVAVLPVTNSSFNAFLPLCGAVAEVQCFV